MIQLRKALALASLNAVVLLAACSSLGTSTTTLQGVVAIGGPLPGASVTVVDTQGLTRSTKANAQGAYSVDVDGMSAPLLVSAIEAGPNTNCRYNATLRARCMAALLPAVHAGNNIANVNPLTDRIASDVAVNLKFIGPQQFVDSGKSAGATVEQIAVATRTMRAGFKSALKEAGVADADSFDPVTAPMKADHTGVDAVLDVINHNRNYDNPTSESSYTVLTDISFRPIVGLVGSGPYEPLDFKRAQKELSEIRNAKVRILIIGDSTAATYELERLPRKGWGQVFEEQFKPGSGVKVLNAARAGRSSKDFYNGGWYQQMSRFMQKGDYVLINHGINDQSCESLKKDRGPADVAGLCTYPNDINGKPQFPAGHPEMSFQKSLQRYVTEARAAGATPVMLTPSTKVWNEARKEGFPVVANHYISPQTGNGFAFTGNYSQTVKDTARVDQVPLIDLEAKTIAFANAHQADWKDYWLAVADKLKYPYYATQASGTFEKPDTTHFQEKGAQVVAGMVADGIRETPELKPLAQLLR
ncbi:GDSL-type esterase/lipase family protein [Uliginosibacterium sp. H3]|uniref:GDSL-type esterase/lipase family protein n=1 Tax=Uliginosibacterium silvisoli TaxID=3114758 RepID=A0ABU6K9L3_9RHOO|nr:GDSL-type esterase/lipase family protein [Uliginosibacterium sp. H3]